MIILMKSTTLDSSLLSNQGLFTVQRCIIIRQYYTILCIHFFDTAQPNSIME